jgi:hypothetical protein
LAAVILGGANAMAASWRGKRKRRVRAHVIADMGINFLERQVLRRGHQLKRVDEPEYGTDALMLHFSPESREIENGWVEFQVKATDNPKFVSNGEYIACQVELAPCTFGTGKSHIPSSWSFTMPRSIALFGLKCRVTLNFTGWEAVEA